MLLLWLNPPLVIPPIHILYFELRPLLGRQIIQTCDVNWHEISDPGFIQRVEWVHTTCFAENLLMALEFVKVVRHRVLAGEKPEVFGFDSNEPEAKFPAIGTVASTWSFGGFNTSFEFDCTTDTTSVILFGCHLLVNFLNIRIGEKAGLFIYYSTPQRSPGFAESQDYKLTPPTKPI